MPRNAPSASRSSGYVALAGDPYGNGLELATVQEAIKLATDLFADTAKARMRVRVALDKLASLPQVDPARLAEIGFCMGGTFGLELARDGAPLKGVVTFHSGLQTQRPAEQGKVKAKILINTGADDPMVPIEAVKAFEEEMTKAGADWEVISYSRTKHSFTNADAASAGMPAALRIQPADRPALVESDGQFLRGNFRVDLTPTPSRMGSGTERRKTWQIRWPSLTRR